MRSYALKHPEMRHRELAWRMVDEDVAYCESVDGVPDFEGRRTWFVRGGGRTKRTPGGGGEGAASGRDLGDGPDVRADRRPDVLPGDASWTSTRGYIVHHELLPGMDGVTRERGGAGGGRRRFLRERGGEIPPAGCREMRSDNGSCYISREFRGVLDEHGLGHQRIKPHCPEENGLMERSNRTLREALEGDGVDGPAASAGRDRRDHPVVQRAAIAFSVGLPAADRLLPGRPGRAARTSGAGRWPRRGIGGERRT